MEKPEEKWALGTPGCKWKNIKIDVKEIRWDSVDWTDLAQARDKWHTFVNMVMSLILFSNEACSHLSGHMNSQIKMY